MGVSSNFISTEYDEDKNLSRVAKKVLECIKLPFKPKLFVIAGKKANAFALANGDIYITEPLFDQDTIVIQSWAFIYLGPRKFGSILKIGGPILKGIWGIKFIILNLLPMLSGDSFNRTLSTIINFQRAKYSQSSEIKADRFGLEGLMCAYGNVDGAISIFEKLRNSQDNDYLFSSHPSFEKRLRIIRGWNGEEVKLRRVTGPF